jgi:D-serine dehydratase
LEIFGRQAKISALRRIASLPLARAKDTGLADSEMAAEPVGIARNAFENGRPDKPRRQERKPVNEFAPVASETILLDDRIRGVPPGTSAFPAVEVAGRNWRPTDGAMALPVLTLDEAAFLHNRDLMLSYARSVGVEIAPHAKTPMSPGLTRLIIDAGAWGATVADIRQASVMLRAGVSRLILANEVGGVGGARRLAQLVAAWPNAELYVFADSVSAVQALAVAWRDHASLPPLRVLVEVGAGRAGARSLDEALKVLSAVRAAEDRLRLGGVATYEGSATQSTPEKTEEAISGLLKLSLELWREVRKLTEPDAPLVVTAGGSMFFDKVAAAIKPAIAVDPGTTLVIRSGVIFFHDHGVYDRAMAALDKRSGFSIDGAARAARGAFRPALRVWAEVLSRPEPELAICGMGKRDVSFDEGLPIALAVHRGGQALASTPNARVVKLNDQHAFLNLARGGDMMVGDVIEFGISHPCTCLDRYRFVFGVDERGVVRHAFPTYFG